MSGFTNLVGCVVIAVGSFAGGLFYEHDAFHWPLMIAAVSVLPAFAFVFFLVHEAKRRKE